MRLLLDDYSTGARVATDLINTAPDVMVTTGDALADPVALQRFLAEHELESEALGDGRLATAGELGQVQGLRADVRAAVEASTHGEAARLAGDLVLRAGTGPVLSTGPDGNVNWVARTRADAGIADELAVVAGIGLLGALRALGHQRFRDCASPTCHGVFVDTSRAGRRRYCMPELCGNRINVVNHRARRRTGNS